MPDFSLLIILAVIIVIWIEFYPKRLDPPVYFFLLGFSWLSVLLLGLSGLPAPTGWAFLVLGLVGLYWTWRRYGRQINWAPLKTFLSSFVRTVSRQAVRARHAIGGFAARRASARSMAGQQEQPPRSTVNRRRLILTALLLVIISPIAAVPLSIALSAMLTIMEFVTQGGGMTAIEQSGVLKVTLGQAYVVLVSSLQILVSKPHFGVPLLFATALGGAAFLLPPDRNARRVMLSAVAVGATYPLMYIVAELSGWLGTGMFN